MIYLDSRDRNQVAYPDPSSYVYRLPASIRNAQSIELMSFQMVRTDPVINASNSTFTVIVGGISRTCVLTQGPVASSGDLATNLQNALTAAVAGMSWAVSASSSGFLTVTANANFMFNLGESVAILLGLVATHPASWLSDNTKQLSGYERGAGVAIAQQTNTTYTMAAKRQADINGDPYVLLFVNDYYPSVSANNLMETSFTAIPLENTQINQRFVICNDLKEKKNIYNLGPVQSKIDTLKISITRPDGTPYATNGIDHLIVFRVVMKDKKNYTS